MCSSDLQDVLERRGLWAPLRANAPFYLASLSNLSANAGGSPVKGKGGGRRAAAPAVRAVYLSAATLVIVPDTLQRQWQSEILKHCTGDVLRYLYVKNNDQLPDAPELATDYDVSEELGWLFGSADVAYAPYSSCS